MSSFNPKDFPILDGSGDRVMYVDDLIAVHEFGPVTHLLFAVCRTEPDGSGPYRVVVTRMVIPTAFRAAIANQLLAGPCKPEVAADPPARLH
jgi:hypothetical protein